MVTRMSKEDYLYEADGNYNPHMVKKILKAAKSKPEKVFSGPNAGKDFLKWLNDPKKKNRKQK